MSIFGTFIMSTTVPDIINPKRIIVLIAPTIITLELLENRVEIHKQTKKAKILFSKAINVISEYSVFYIDKLNIKQIIDLHHNEDKRGKGQNDRSKFDVNHLESNQKKK